MNYLFNTKKVIMRIRGTKHKSYFISNYVKFKHSNYQAEIGRMDFLKDQTICFLQGTQFRFKDTNRMEYTLTHIHTHAMQTVKKRELK